MTSTYHHARNVANESVNVNAKKKRRKKMIRELCGFCGDTVEDCASIQECNYGVVGYEDDTCASCNGKCRCDYEYDRMREKENEEDQDYGDDD
jgi:hypothetical protein